MRPFIAWLLLLPITFQWVIGRVYISYNCDVEIVSRMNEKEESLSRLIHEESGISSHIRILDEISVKEVFTGYGYDFIFSREFQGETVYYMIENDPVKILNYEYFIKAGADEESGTEKAFIYERYFSHYFHSIKNLPAVITIDTLYAGIFPITCMQDLFTASIPVPPPREA